MNNGSQLNWPMSSWSQHMHSEKASSLIPPQRDIKSDPGFVACPRAKKRSMNEGAYF